MSDDFELKIGATVLKRVTSYKYLGIVDNKLTQKEHIDYIYIYNNIVKYVSIFIELNIDYLVKHWKWFILHLYILDYVMEVRYMEIPIKHT